MGAGEAAEKRALAQPAGHLRQAQVADLGGSAFAEQDIRRLQVSVHHPELVVDHIQSFTDFERQPQRFVKIQWSFLFDPLGQAAARGVFHHQVELALVFFEIMNLDDVGVVQARPQLSFKLEALAHIAEVAASHAGHLHPQHLDGARCAQAQVRDVVHLGESAAPGELFHPVFVVADARTWFEDHA